MSKPAGYRKTPKARENRKRQLKRSGYANDLIDDIIYLEFDGGVMHKAPSAPLPSKKYNKGGIVRIF